MQTLICQRKMNLWKKYKDVLHETFPLHNRAGSVWAQWESKGTSLTAKTYTTPYFIKAREVEIWDDKSCIYNNIIYPKTGSNLPCFGMDLMGFFQKKVIIVFDFQHPVERHVFSVDGLPEAEKEYRFFEMGNHFSKNIFVRYCTFDEVDYYLPEFRLYLETYRKMIDKAKPTGEDISFYQDFDTYMKKLDPILGYMSSNFGEDNANLMMDEFFFPYAI